MTQRRRLCIATGAASLAAIAGRSSHAQSRSWRIGLIHVGSDHVPPSYSPLLDGMRALGYEDGKNIRYDFRNVSDDGAAGEAARAFAREKVDMIIAFDQEACLAAKKATLTIPIVMINATSPIAGGFAKTLARPGGNMTGFAGRAELPAKELEILRDIAPRLKRALLIFDSRDAASVALRDDSRIAASKLGMTLVERDAGDPAALKALFEKIKRGDAEAVLITSTAVRHRYQKQVLALATAHGMAMIGSRKDVVDAGALLSYSYDFAKVGRLAASRYVDRILKGTKPADLPVEEMTEYQLVVNRGVAKRHGWTLQESVVLRAEQIIE